VSAEIVIRQFSLEFSYLVAEISDDCILGVDFLRRINLIGILEPEFGNEVFSNNKTMNCSRMISEEKILAFLNGLLQQSSKELSVV